MKCNHKKDDIRPINIGCLTEFPFIDETFDSVTEWQILQKLGGKTNEIIRFINNTLDSTLQEYIDKRFNEIIINSMYEEETETLVLYLDKESEE